MELFGAITITRKIILEGRLVVVDGHSGDGAIGGGIGAAVGANNAPLTIFKANYFEYDHTGYTDFASSSECSACKCQDCRAKHDVVINVINALTASVKELTSKRGLIPSKRILFPSTLLEIRAKQRRRVISRALSSIQKSKIATPLSVCCTEQHTMSKGEQHKLKKAKHDGVINTINALTTYVKEMISKRGVIPSKRIPYPDTPLEIKATKRERKDTSKASSIKKKKKIPSPLSLYCTDVQCAWDTEEQHELKKVDVTAPAEEHNMTVDNPSTAFKDEERVEPASLGERKNYPFEGFNISGEAPKKLTQFIDDYLEWITDGLLKHHVGSISAGLPWHLVNEVYIPINCGNEFYWVLAVVVLTERRIRIYDSMSRRRYSGPSSEIQKLAKILPTYLDMRGFLDQKVRTDWSMIAAYRDKMASPFDVQYVDEISQ
ncbi:hypothetical protein CQW23_01049 [Capsicum baccatum]|uniref:Ubiquitin-like protease family profile domain-containing protein n=1 Tax=Capsicum baccatum TaxID=33114 RepID=A0A2G2XMG6_CAPBA|nr:hypothetical protein CQW23_01049 [Capsicum baccatum]